MADVAQPGSSGGVAPSTPFVYCHCLGGPVCIDRVDHFAQASCEVLRSEPSGAVVHAPKEPVWVWDGEAWTPLRALTLASTPEVPWFLATRCGCVTVSATTRLYTEADGPQAAHALVVGCRMALPVLAPPPAAPVSSHTLTEDPQWDVGYFYAAVFGAGSFTRFWRKDRKRWRWAWKVERRQRAWVFAVATAGDSYTGTGREGTIFRVSQRRNGYWYLRILGDPHCVVDRLYGQTRTADGCKRVPPEVLNATHFMRQGFMVGCKDSFGHKWRLRNRPSRRYTVNNPVGALGLYHVAVSAGYAATVSFQKTPGGPSLRVYNINMPVDVHAPCPQKRRRKVPDGALKQVGPTAGGPVPMYSLHTDSHKIVVGVGVSLVEA